MNKVPNNEQNIHIENAIVGIQNNIQGNNNTVTNYYLETKEPELEDFNFPKLIDSFKGREDEFKQLDDYLFLKDKKMVVIWGLPGFGKSECLKQFAQKCKLNSKIKYICWIQASNTDTLKHSLKDLVKILKLPDVDGLRNLLQKVSHRYQKSETLFVFDDVDSPRSLLDWETPSSCWTLISSQLGEWGTISCVELGPLDRETAIAVLQHQQVPAVITNPDLCTLAELLDKAPLALQLAAAYIRQEMKLFPKKFNMLKYIKKLRKSPEKIVNEPAHTLLPYEYRIHEAMDLSLDKIRKLNTFESNLALDILNIIAYLNQQIRERTLLKFTFIQNKLKEEEDEDEEWEEEVRRALYVLQSYSFVHLEDDFIRIHGLVQHTVIFYHNKPNANMESYYTSCLEYVLNNHFNGHSLTILKQADKKLKIFTKFFDEYKSKIIYEYKANSNYKKIYPFLSYDIDSFIQLPVIVSELGDSIKYGDDNFKNKTTDGRGIINTITSHITNRSFLGKLIIAKAEKCLIIILDKLDSQAKKVIIDHPLLFDAIDSREPDMIKLLQKYEKDIIKKTTVGDYYILHYTICFNLDILNFILEHNIDVNARDDEGYTCISQLVLYTFMLQPNISDEIFQMMRTLVNYGASVYNVANGGWSLLHVAIISIKSAMHLKVVEFIVDDLQVDVNRPNDASWTVLHTILCRRAKQKIDDELTSKLVDVLMRRGASVHIKEKKYGYSPLDLIKINEFHFLLPIVTKHNENK